MQNKGLASYREIPFQDKHDCVLPPCILMWENPNYFPHVQTMKFRCPNRNFFMFRYIDMPLVTLNRVFVVIIRV